jgi:secondary thiamine-phosphate synthase enzyme
MPKLPLDRPDDGHGKQDPHKEGGAAVAFGALPGQSFAQANQSLVVRTRGQGFVDITGQVSDWLASIGAENGLLTLFIAHTSASLTIQENADPDVRYDLRAALERLAPESSTYRHSLEGPDDMPAHIKAMLTSVSLSIPVLEGRTALGTWQGIYVIEHRSHPHDRKLELHFIGVRQT